MKRPFHLAVAAVLIFGIASAGAQTTLPATAPYVPPNGFIQTLVLVLAMRAQVAKRVKQVTQKASYEPAAKKLALLCQSDQFFFLDEPPFRPAWLPPEVLKLDPTWVQITPDDAHVEFGGGFQHFGYELTQNKSAGNDAQNNWSLNFYNENSASKTLMTFMVDKTDHVDQKQFVSGALAEFERRAQSPTFSDKDVNERLVFLLKFNEVEMARASVRSCAAANPRDWADQLLAFIIDAKTDPAASVRLDAWAGKIGDFSAWLMAAYTCGIAGDDDSMERCTKTALTQTVDDPDWSMANARYRGATVCAQLLKARRYTTCAALCDALLAYKDSGQYLAPQIISIRDLARHSTGADSPPAFEDGTVFSPFKGIDLSRLAVAKSATSPLSKNNASTEPSGESRDRLLEYYDHRISAEPTVRANYTVKITYLLSQHKTSDALGACKVAAQVFPGWWRPQMALVVLADPDAQKQAEPQFRKWVEAHPAFIHWWYLSRYYRDLGRDNDAAAALRNAIKYPLEMVDQDETWVPQAFAFDAASYAYRQKRYKLVLNIARVWSSPRGIYNYFDDDIYAFRAAAELALGQFADAKTDADKVVAAASKNAIWAEHLSELQQAANAKNQAFVYEPGDPCGDWTLFPMP